MLYTHTMRLLLALLALSACGGTTMATNEHHLGWRLRGQLHADVREGETLFLVSERWNEGQWQGLGFQRRQPGSFDMISDVLWTIRLGAFIDQNGDGQHQLSEPAVHAAVEFEPSSDRDYGTRDGIVLRVHRSSRLRQRLTIADTERRSISAGEVVSLDDALFSLEAAELGVRDPLQFMRDYTAGFFLLAPWDEDKEPVFFVHGLGGSVRQMQPIIQALDTERFQPVLTVYPSGWRLADVATYFDDVLDEFVAAYPATNIHIIAHSMGGLVVRKALGERSRRGGENVVRTFTSIASPLGGHPSALAGVRFAPRSVPAWSDLALPSAFLRDLYRDPLPEGMVYRLLFTTQDESVPLESQQRDSAMREASATLGVDAGHVEVLARPETLDFVCAPFH
ncbi:MAG: pimeloyl-ACP methyl ester carboxylesterase [Polyangiales bacterium]|jgi:pimeloyl-ACP methyl ester carboxylesterase